MKLKYFLCSVIFLIYNQSKGQEADLSPATYVKPLFDFDVSKPVFKLSKEQLENKRKLLRFYAFTGYREGVEPIKRPFDFNMDTKVDQNQGTISQRMYNLSIEEMVSFGMTKSWQIILEVKDPSKYRYLPSYGSKLEWMRKNGHCYEMTVPKEFASKCLKIVEDDIDKFFNIKRAKEDRITKVLVLSALDPKKEAIEIPRVMEGPGVMNFEELKEYLINAGFPLLILDFYKSDRLFDIGELAKQGQAMKIADLQQVLLKQGFKLREEMRKVNFLVIREAK